MNNVPRKYWKTTEIQVLKNLYATTPNKALAVLFNCSVRSVFCKANELGLFKSQHYLHSPESGRLDGKRGVRNRFQKGWNQHAN